MSVIVVMLWTYSQIKEAFALNKAVILYPPSSDDELINSAHLHHSMNDVTATVICRGYQMSLPVVFLDIDGDLKVWDNDAFFSNWVWKTKPKAAPAAAL